MKAFDNIEIILVKPESSGNIGSVARAMNNMGFTRLGLISPAADHLCLDAIKMAWNSHALLKNATLYATLPEALKNKVFVVATSTRLGKDRGHFSALEDKILELRTCAKNHDVAILFGCESHGLENEDLLLANQVVRINTAGHYPSLNLAQAVLIVCYELLRAENKSKKTANAVHGASCKPALNQELEQCFTHIESTLAKLGYGVKGDRLLPEKIIPVIRRFLGRAHPTGLEVQMIRGLCSQVEKALSGSLLERFLEKQKKERAKGAPKTL
jgi:TrmH family RNA methyltransferase